MKGFSLIELLTVVLIVGILSAIALPQYTKAVEKSRAAEAMTLCKSVIEAQNRSLAAFPNASVARKGAIDVQLTGGTWNSNNANANTYTTDLFVYTLLSTGCRAHRRNGAYSGYELTFGHDGTGSCTDGEGSICASFSGIIGL